MHCMFGLCNRMRGQIRAFEDAAGATARILIHEMFLPGDVARTIGSASGMGGIAGGEKFLHQGIFFKLVRQSALCVRVQRAIVHSIALCGCQIPSPFLCSKNLHRFLVWPGTARTNWQLLQQPMKFTAYGCTLSRTCWS